MHLDDIWDSVAAVADRYDGDGVHVLSFFRTFDERARFEKAFFPRHRLVWLNEGYQKAWELGRLGGAIQDLLAFEEEWCRNVRPNNVRHALILPDRAFETRPPYDELWKRSMRMHLDDKQTFDDLRRQTLAFRREYKQLSGDFSGCWRDEAGRVFKVPSPQDWHANAVPRSQRWKCSWTLPHGFHFDVCAEKGNGFTALDEVAAPRRYVRYANIDSLNFHRGGE